MAHPCPYCMIEHNPYMACGWNRVTVWSRENNGWATRDLAPGEKKCGDCGHLFGANPNCASCRTQYSSRVMSTSAYTTILPPGWPKKPPGSFFMNKPEALTPKELLQMACSGMMGSTLTLQYKLEKNEWPQLVPAIRWALEMIEAQEKEIEGMRAVVERLPRTADGKPVVPGMELWDISHGELDGETVSTDMIACSMSLRSPDSCYSTRDTADAALAARRGKTT